MPQTVKALNVKRRKYEFHDAITGTWALLRQMSPQRRNTVVYCI